MFKCVLSGIADVFCPAFGPNQCALSRPSAGNELARIFSTAAIGFGAETIVPIIFPGTPGCFESRAGMAASCFEQPRREVQRKAERRRIVSVSKSSWLGGPVVFCELLTSRGRNRNEGKESASTCGSTPEDSKDRNHGTRLA